LGIRLEVLRDPAVTPTRDEEATFHIRTTETVPSAMSVDATCPCVATVLQDTEYGGRTPAS
jgi:hypothetical protein